MSTCNITTLQQEACANKFSCLDSKVYQGVFLQLLCDIKNNGTGGGGAQSLFIDNYGGLTPTDTPTGTTAFAFDTSNWTTWAWYAGAWHQLSYTGSQALGAIVKTAWTFPHGLPATPGYVNAYFECIGNDAATGYVVGDQVDVRSVHHSVLFIPGMCISVNATNIIVSSPDINGPIVGSEGNYTFITKAGGGAGTNPTSFANFQLTVYAHL